MSKTQRVKGATMFDVLNKMPESAMKIFMSTAGGRQVGRGKAKNAIIEVVVDNETFQDFAFQKTYGHAKASSNRQYFISVAVNADEYDKQLKILKK